MISHFTFNGISSYNYGLYVNSISAFDTAQLDTESISIPGRNGDLILSNNRYTNVKASYEVGVTSNFKDRSRDLASWLLQDGAYHRLTDSYYPLYYRMARYGGSLTYEVKCLYERGKSILTFDCRPERFLVSGETSTSYTGTRTVTNPTKFPAKPIIRIYATGTLVVNGYTITVNSIDGYVDIDCEQMNAYKGSTNCNGNVTVDEFPVLNSGNNTITAPSSSFQYDITPRWWTL